VAGPANLTRPCSLAGSRMPGLSGVYWGSREDFVHPAAQKTPQSPNPPDIVHHRALVPHGTHRRRLPPWPENDRGTITAGTGTRWPNGARRCVPPATVTSAAPS
jgi:hypothetical protein